MSFFICQAKTLKKTADGRALDLDPMVLAQGDNQFIKRRVLLPQNVGADPRLHVGQLAPARIALTLRRQAAGLALQFHHVVDEPHRHAEVRRRRAMRMTFLGEVDYAPAKLDWMRPSHRNPSRCHSKKRESQKSEPGEPP